MLKLNNREGKMLVTLRSGEQKWMTKREYLNYLKRLEALKSVYDEFVKYDIIDFSAGIEEQVHELVNKGCELMFDICNLADSITISGYNRIKNEISSKITKAQFIEIVRYVSNHLDSDKTIDDAKFTAKLLKEVDEAIYKINLNRIFYINFAEFNDFAIPDDSQKVAFPKLDTKINKRFKEIVKSCAKVRHELDKKLWPAMREYAAVAEYITKGHLDYIRFKQLVDYQYYADNDDKRFQNLNKRFKIMAKKFMDVYKLCKTYGYDNYFEDVEALIYKYTVDEEIDEGCEQYKNMA